MKLKDLISKLQALNPEAEVYFDALLTPLRVQRIHPGFANPFPLGGIEVAMREATPSDTLIVLSE